MELIKRNRLSELYSMQREVSECIAALVDKESPDDEDKALLSTLKTELDGINRRITAVKNMPEDGA